MMLVGQGSITEVLADATVERLLADAFDQQAWDGQRVLVIIPDGTRTAPMPLLFRLLYQCLGSRVARLDYLIALGTHPPMDEAAIEQLLGVSAAQRAVEYPNVTVYNHQWSQPEMLTTVGVIDAATVHTLSEGMLHQPIEVTLNRRILDYDQLVICGPVFPHEVAGFSGGAKYLFPGIAGAEIIDATHWLGALSTSMQTIGVKDTLVRRVIHQAAALVPRPVLCIALVLQGYALHGMYIGASEVAWNAAADLSAHLNIVWLSQPVQRVLALASPKYADLWTAAKAMYKTEPVVADGGEVVIYAPHVSEISYTHGALIDQIGYHVCDYFTKQWHRFKDISGGILAHSTHVKGTGTYNAATGIETPRITVTLATSIPQSRCNLVNLGYTDHHSIDLEAWQSRDDVLVVHHAGEVLYRLRP